MDPNDKPEKRQYVVLVFLDVDPEYYELGREKREKISAPHIKDLSVHSKYVSLTSLKTTGLSPKKMIEVLESENLMEIEGMLDTYAAGAKSRFATISDVIITEKGMVRPMTG